jgi:hypothetical protein
MALPGGVTPITVTGTVANHKGVTATGGTVTFRMPYALSDGIDHIVLAPGIWSFDIGSDGTINTASDPMPAAVISGVSPSGWAYEVTVRAVLADASVFYRKFFVQINADASFEQLLAAAAPTPSPAYAYLPLSAVGVMVAPLVGGHVPSQFLPPGGGGSGIESVAALNGTITVDDTDPLNPAVGVGTGIPQGSVSGLTSRLAQNDDDVVAAANAAAGAATAAASALSAAGTAQTAANAAYVKPGPGIPEADLTAAVSASLGLADTALQSVPPQPNPDAERFGGHSCNLPLHAVTKVSTINNEAWAALVPVKAGVPIGGAFTFSTNDPATHSITGNNGFAVYDVPAGGGPGALLGTSVSDDVMWETAGKVDKPISGVPTPAVDGLRLVVVSVRGYSDAPTFGFADFADAGASSIGVLFGKYKSGGFATWPATIDVAADLVSGVGFVLPVFLRR